MLLTVKCGQEASSVGSSSSGSKSGLSLGGSVRNKLQAIWKEEQACRLMARTWVVQGLAQLSPYRYLIRKTSSIKEGALGDNSQVSIDQPETA